MTNTNYGDYTYSPVERFELAEGDSIRCDYCYDTGLTDEAQYCTCEAGILEARRATEVEAQEPYCDDGDDGQALASAVWGTEEDYRNGIEDSWLDGSYEMP